MGSGEILNAIGNAAETIASPNYADKLALILSLIAILCATGVAIFQSRISNQQNKIALFEKKYSVYCELFKIINVGDQLDYSEPHKRFSLLHEIEVIYGADFLIGQSTTAQLAAVLTQIKRSEYIIRQSIFLFDCIKETDISELIDALMDCMIFIIKDNSEEINIKSYDINKFIKICNDFNTKYLDSIESELSLK